MASSILGEAWNISEKGLEIITKNHTIKDKHEILKNAIDSDLKEIGAPTLVDIQNKSSISQVVLQIQKLRNVAAPKANEYSNLAPRMLKLLLTDGENSIQAIEIGLLPSINLDMTPPGSKLLIHSAKVYSGYLLLDATNCSLLGGQVPNLREKWELTKSVHHRFRQSSSTDGPPVWINFGNKIKLDIQDKPFKSLENKNPETKENTKFDLQRQGAIAEASAGAVKKIFGGGIKQQNIGPSPIVSSMKQNDYRERRSARHKSGSKEMEEEAQKPSQRVSLFDFLEDKFLSNNAAQIEGTITTNINNKLKDSSQSKIKKYPYQRTKFTDTQQNNSFRDNNKNEEHNVNGLTANLQKVSLNTHFASRSLKQHLNLDLNKIKNFDTHSTVTAWKVGDECTAKYWEDGKFYNAVVTAVTETTCVVKFKGYENIEEVLKSDCVPVFTRDSNKRQHQPSGEFRRNASRPYRRQH